ncbi:MAG: DNA-formamidopyrimidine glycosylase [Myxococcales bacterium]|nr:DNA-formamidopyrimidine glycosylase [Myxococcales bacterium]|tara:strand:- start:7 stop:822 length:816 start_codon:yes stop_codon:yes gene_type:complete
MPELPEVETVRRELEPWLVGRQILTARRVDAPPGPKYANLEKAAGQTVLSVDRRGKFLVLPLDSGDELVIHLGMTGIISPNKPVNHIRVRLELDGEGDTQLYFRDVRRFGRFLVAPNGDHSSLPTLFHMGPEPLSDDFTVRALAVGLDSGTAIKTRLHSQRPVAGLGNIYIDEALWVTRIHPLTVSRRISMKKVRALRDAIQDILAKSIDAQGTTLMDYRTVNGRPGSYIGELNAYGRAGQPCRRCKTVLQRIVVGQRSTHFCPRCQKRLT